MQFFVANNGEADNTKKIVLRVDSKNISEIYDNAKTKVPYSRWGYKEIKALILNYNNISVRYIN